MARHRSSSTRSGRSFAGRAPRQPARSDSGGRSARCSADAARERPEDARSSGRCSDVSFEVGPGEALGIIGPNGAGKSTTLKLLTRILRPTRGTLRGDGPGRRAHRSRGRLPSRPDRPREHLSAGRDHGDEARRDRREVRRDRRVRRRRRVHRHAGQALLVRHERAARLLDRRAPEPGRADHRRSAERRRHGVSGEVHRADARASSARASPSSSSRTTCRRSPNCATSVLPESAGAGATVRPPTSINSYVTRLVRRPVEGDAWRNPDRLGDASTRSTALLVDDPVAPGTTLNLSVEFDVREPIDEVTFACRLHRATDQLAGVRRTLLAARAGHGLAPGPFRLQYQFDVNLTRGQYYFDVFAPHTPTQRYLGRLRPAAHVTVAETRTWGGVAHIAAARVGETVGFVRLAESRARRRHSWLNPKRIDAHVAAQRPSGSPSSDAARSRKAFICRCWPATKA